MRPCRAALALSYRLFLPLAHMLSFALARAGHTCCRSLASDSRRLDPMVIYVSPIGALPALALEGVAAHPALTQPSAIDAPAGSACASSPPILRQRPLRCCCRRHSSPIGPCPGNGHAQQRGSGLRMLNWASVAASRRRCTRHTRDALRREHQDRDHHDLLSQRDLDPVDLRDEHDRKRESVIEPSRLNE